MTPLQSSGQTAVDIQLEDFSDAALDALRRGVILGTNMNLDFLAIEERELHVQLLEKIAVGEKP